MNSPQLIAKLAILAWVALFAWFAYSYGCQCIDEAIRTLDEPWDGVPVRSRIE